MDRLPVPNTFLSPPNLPNLLGPNHNISPSSLSLSSTPKIPNFALSLSQGSTPLPSPAMKLDTSIFESHAPLLAGADDLFSDLLKPSSFDLPICGDFDGFQKDAIQMVKPAKGTTTLAFIFKDGTMVAADSRASMGGYISSQSVKKIIEINPYMLGTMTGVAADCQFWHRNLGIKYHLHELANKRRISVTGLQSFWTIFCIPIAGWACQLEQ